MIAANDGGVDVTVNGGETWFAPPLPFGQFYHVAVDTRVPFHLSGAQQDLGTAVGPEQHPEHVGPARCPTGTRWAAARPGTRRTTPPIPNIVYAGEYLGYMSAWDERTRQSRNISAWPENPSGHGGEDMRYRFQWTAPIALSPHDPHVIYHAANVLFTSTDDGRTWTAISPDLTRNDKSKQKWAGGPITGDNTGVETYCTIFAVAESPKQKGLIWAGTDDGLVHVTRDGGKTWKNVTSAIAGLPEWGTVSLIEPSPFDAGTAYVVVDAHRLDDMRPYLFKTADFGQTWTRLDAKLDRATLSARRPRGPGPQGAPLRRHRARRHGLARRRGDVAAAAAEPADGGGARPGGEGPLAGGGDARPVVLDPRRPRGGAGADAGGDRVGGAPVPARRHHRVALHVRWTRGGRRTEPAAGRRDPLLPEGASRRET